MNWSHGLKGIKGFGSRAVLVLTLALVAGMALPMAASADPGPSVYLSPASQSLATGKTTTVTIMIKDVSNLFAAEVHLSFPKTLLEVVDADGAMDGVQIAPSSALFPFVTGQYTVEAGTGKKYYFQYSAASGGYFYAQAGADNTAGTIDYAVTLISPAAAVSAGAAGKALATITFNGLAEGEASISVASVKLADADAAPIEMVSTSGATITLGAFPTVVSTTPAKGASDVPINTNISVTFNKTMDKSLTQGAFSIDPSVGGAFSWADSDKTLTFDPTSDLAYSTTYDITVTAAAKGANGIALDGDEDGVLEGSPADDYSWSFTTVAKPEISNLKVTNVADLSFAVSWTTSVITAGLIKWGTSAASLTNTAYDDRGQPTQDDTHHVSVTVPSALTKYYYVVVSAGITYDNGGVPYEITTGPGGLDFKMPDIIGGKVFKFGGVTAAQGAIVYVQIGTSQVLSGLVDSAGSWGMDIGPIRNAAYSAYYAFSATDNILIQAQGGADGTASQTVTVDTARAGAPDMTLVPNLPPVVENVTASQTAGTGTVSIAYDVKEQDEKDTSVTVSFAYWNGTTYATATTVTGSGTKAVTLSATHYTGTWDAKTDFDGNYMTDAKIKVIANDGKALGIGEGVSSSFTLDTKGPTGVACVSPADQATDVALKPTLTAASASDPSTPISYYFIIAKDQNFQTGVQESGWISTNTWVPSNALEAPTVDYWWKVKAKDSFGNVSQGSAFKLTTLAVVPVEVSLVSGWNIIALAAQPVTPFTAKTLAADIANQGGNITQVFRWNTTTGRWDFYLVATNYGTNFNIEVGLGYLLKSTKPSTWTYWGVPLSAKYEATVEPRVSDVADVSFTISWISQSAEQGSVKWGTSAASLTSTAYDCRGQTTQDDTHHVSVTVPSASTKYYYEVVSGSTTYNNGGVPYEITTGPGGLEFKMPDIIGGKVFKTGGVTAAQGAIVYVQIGTSQVLSGLVDSAGSWGIDIGPIRKADYSGYYAYTETDSVSLQAQGGADGAASKTTTVATARAGSPGTDIVVSVTAKLALVAGWNLISLPIEPATSYVAQTLAAEINSQGGNITQVFWWNATAGRWDFRLVATNYGTNFTIRMGEGYLLKSTKVSTWTIPGK